MKHRILRPVFRALSLVLALALPGLTFAFAEEVPAEYDDALELVLPDSDIEDMPEAAAEPVFDEAVEAAVAEADPAIASVQADTPVQSNTSEPADVYESEHYVFDVGEKSSYTVMIGDTLEIFFPKSNGKSWSSSKPSVVKISSASDRESVYLSARAKGASKLTLKLTTGKVYTITVNVNDPYALRSMSLKKKSVTLSAGMDLNLADYITMTPSYATSAFTYKSSKTSVAKVSAGGIVTGMKPGTATITVVSNGIKKKLKVTVKRNNLSKLHSKPTKKATKAQGKKWTLWPRSLELRGNGTLICKLYLLNGSGGKIKSLRNLDLSISLATDNGDNLIAQHTFSKVSVRCSKKKYTTVKLTIPAKHVYYSGMKLSSLDASKLRFRLYSKPTAKNGKHTYAYRPTAIKVTNDPTDDNPVSYRALLVSEDDFYLSRTSGLSYAWEHITRNRSDVALMKSMLGKVRTPDGTRYSVKVKHNTSKAALLKAIQTTFADADENDVSLFFIATHGDSSDDTPAKKSGALYMASLDDTYPEYLYLSELRNQLLKVPGKVIVILESCGSGASIYKSNAAGVRAAESFDSEAVDLFREADPGVVTAPSGGAAVATNTGELRKSNKFYVLCCSEYREESWGLEPGDNFFTKWLTQGVGKSGSMPADKKYAGNKNGIVDLHELYRYISGVGDRILIQADDAAYYQHVQVYPSNIRYALFK